MEKSAVISDKVTHDVLSEKKDSPEQNARITPSPDSDLVLYAEQWELIHSGDTILSLPVLHRLINTWLQNRQKTIEIRYPGGEEGEFWVQQLIDWLVALGIPSEHIVSIIGSGSDDVIRFELITE